MRRSLVLLALALGVLSVPLRRLVAPSVAGTAVRMDLEQLVDAADLVVEGRVVAAQGVLAPDGLVHTEVQLAVERTFWGEDQALRTFRLPGGQLPDGHGTVFPGLPHLHVGEHVVLALSRESALGCRLVCGLEQGLWRVVPDGRGGKLAVNGPATVVGEAGALPSAAAPQVREHADLVAHLTAAAAARRARAGDAERREGR